MNREQRRSLELSEQAYKLVKDLLSEKDRKTVGEYISVHSEWGLGVETLIDILLELDVVLSMSQKEAILAAAESMDINRGQQCLKEGVSDDKHAI